MKSTRSFRILALENDRVRGSRLTDLLRKHLDVDVVVAQTGDEAIEAMSTPPDVVLVSALLSPKDEAQLVAHLNETNRGADLPLLTMPPIVEQAAEDTRAWRVSFFGRQPKAPRPLFDPDAIVSRVREALEQAQSVRLAARRRERESRVIVDAQTAVIEPSLETALALVRGADAERQRAHRWVPSDLPWAFRAETSWGLELSVLNVSRSGMLVESGSKLVPDSVTEFRLLAEDRMLVMPARVVRSEVAAVDIKGVRYRAAAVFAKQFALISDVSQFGGASTPCNLSQLISQVTADVQTGKHAAYVRTQLERGLEQLAPALQIKIQETPVAPEGLRESIYFTIPCATDARAVLQASFEPDYEITAREYKLLQAAAAAAGAVLSTEQHRTPRLLAAAGA
jgi:DNA-binding response OmpR family regulator